MVTILMMILVIGLDHLTKYMAISLKEGEIVIFDKFLKLTYLWKFCQSDFLMLLLKVAHILLFQNSSSFCNS